ncbi:hypothetical protein [Dactylosporangium roseum]|uniref:hypothetical protein n=1 Tax=Dactylosporangium roseum TaxID=47989 RepID=UPI0021B48EB1|nr:hypothetical protein [Dactylosporangium roseum]
MSVNDLAERLPDVENLRNISRSLAALDAIVMLDWESRYYSYDSTWGADEQLASMKNDSGDEYSIVFGPTGVFIRGFDHESSMSPYRRSPHQPWPGVIDSVPEEFRQYVFEPAFSSGEFPLITVCLWRLSGSDSRWRFGEIEYPEGEADPDGSGWMFDLVVNRSPLLYVGFAEDAYEVELDESAVAAVYDLEPMTQELIGRLNPELLLDEARESLEAIGYPVLGDS